MSNQTTPTQTNVVSMRLDDELVQHLLAFRDTFDPPHTTVAMRWLLTDPRVRDIMRERITSVTTKKRNRQLDL